MEAPERSHRLLDALRRDGRVEVGAAAAEFGTSGMTIRRDLDSLVGRGVARRVLDGSTFSHSGMAAVCPLSAFDAVVTDSTAPAATLSALDAAGVAVHRA